MKQVWLNLPVWVKDFVTESLESGVDAVLTTDELASKVRELGRIPVVSPENGDIKVPDDVEIIVIRDKKDENRAAEALKKKIVVARTTDWNIIPIENLIPQAGDRLFVFVASMEEAKLAAGILEKGVSGIVMENVDRAAISMITRYIKDLDRETFSPSVFEITSVKNIGMGDRVCVDTCTNLNIGEGMLVGNSSRGMFLVHAENIENPYVAPRPFRVNAGAVHSYVKIPGDKTKYLGELKSGDPILIADKSGTTSIANVGRSKIEKRPLLVVSARAHDGTEYSVVLQNAETIRLTGEDGSPRSVVHLVKGDKVLGYVEGGGRHFGMSVDESIMEK